MRNRTAHLGLVVAFGVAVAATSGLLPRRARAAGERGPKPFTRNVVLRPFESFFLEVPDGKRLVIRDVMTSFTYDSLTYGYPQLFLGECDKDEDSCRFGVEILAEQPINPDGAGVARFREHLTSGIVISSPHQLGIVAYGPPPDYEIQLTLCGTIE